MTPWACAFACLLTTSTMAAQPDGPGVAIINLDQAFATSKAGRAVIGTLTSREATARDQVAVRQADLDTRRQALSRLSPSASPVRRAQEREVARFELDVQRFIEDTQAELFQLRRSAEEAFLLQLRPAVASIAKERGLRIVLSADSTLIAWAERAMDITGEVVARLDAPVKR